MSPGTTGRFPAQVAGRVATDLAMQRQRPEDLGAQALSWPWVWGVPAEPRNV